MLSSNSLQTRPTAVRVEQSPFTQSKGDSRASDRGTVLDIWVVVNGSSVVWVLSAPRGRPGESRVPVVLPPNPICYHKVRRRWNQEEGKVLIMRVEQKDVEGLGGSFNTFNLWLGVHCRVLRTAKPVRGPPTRIHPPKRKKRAVPTRTKYAPVSEGDSGCPWGISKWEGCPQLSLWEA